MANDSTTNNNRSGIYSGTGGLYAIEDFDSDALNFDNAPGFNLRPGYHFHPHVAVEAVGERIDAFDFNDTFVFSGFFGSPTSQSIERSANVNTWAGTLNGKIFALTGQFQPYALLGIGFLHAHSKLKASGSGIEPVSAKSNSFGLAFR